MVTSRTWRVGELARATGLTVRTLHHYDQVGLLHPSGRTAAGHRLYDERDAARLYRIVALRDLGLALEAIGELLDGGPDLGQLLSEHLAHVDRQLTALQALRARLLGVATALPPGGSPDATDLLALVEEVTRVDETMQRYFSTEQLAELSQRDRQAAEATAAEWGTLIPQVRAELDAGTDPAEPRVQTLVARWNELLAGFHRGDPAMLDSLSRMRDGESADVERQGGPSTELIEYVRRANAAG